LTRVALIGEYAPTIARFHIQRRYSPEIHVDLLDVVTAYGTAPKLRLHQLCSAFSIPSKWDVDGGDVATLVASGDWQMVVNYCETDVVATYLALQMWQGAEKEGMPSEPWRVGPS
jgi:predicted PolB exonuclease-like 3'-5' exonuclease